ncbi:MAG: type II toxin-antitoxin system VapB family antitoxin [Ignavibacteria bacterium]|nr:type II toxin-antitoxin system VapB family antitoxin [Ignavibacteria bacterium]
MKTVINIDEELVSKAILLTGIKEKNLLINRSLNYLIEMESSKKLASFGNSEKGLKSIRRRRTKI